MAGGNAGLYDHKNLEWRSAPQLLVPVTPLQGVVKYCMGFNNYKYYGPASLV